jgi:hypothetical protein
MRTAEVTPGTPSFGRVVATASALMALVEVGGYLASRSMCAERDCWPGSVVLVGAAVAAPLAVAFVMRRSRLRFLECVGVAIFTTAIAPFIVYLTDALVRGELGDGHLLFLMGYSAIFVAILVLPVAALILLFHRIMAKVSRDRRAARERSTSGATLGR